MVRHFMAPYRFELEQNYEPSDVIQSLVSLLQRGFADQDKNTLLKVKEINIVNSTINYTIKLQTLTQSTNMNNPVTPVHTTNLVVIDNVTNRNVTIPTIINDINGLRERVEGLRVYGEIDYGKYNNMFDLIDSTSMSINAIIPPTKSPADAYFYMFYFTSLRTGFLILERIGNVGIRTSLQKAIKNTYRNMWIKVDPVIIGLREILRNPVKKIKIQRPAPSREALLDELGVDDVREVNEEIIFSAKRNRNLTERLSNWVENGELSNLARIVEEYYGEDSLVSVEVKIGEHTRTIHVNSGRFRSWVEIEPESDKYRRAINIINDMQDEWVNPEN